MSDVPTAAAWTVAFLCVTAGTVASSAAGGVAAALAILIRPNLAPLAVLALLWFILEARSDPPGRRRHLKRAAAFLTTMLPSIVITALLNQRWYGSPLTSGYGSVEDIFSLGNVLPNLEQYAVWLSQTQTPLAFLGIAALLVPASWLWPAGGKRSTVIVLGSVRPRGLGGIFRVSHLRRLVGPAVSAAVVRLHDDRDGDVVLLASHSSRAADSQVAATAMLLTWRCAWR